MSGSRISPQRPRYPCRYPSCRSTFGRRCDAKRHEKEIHHSPHKIFCPFTGCSFRGAKRANVLREHIRIHHTSPRAQYQQYSCYFPAETTQLLPSTSPSSSAYSSNLHLFDVQSLTNSTLADLVDWNLMSVDPFVFDKPITFCGVMHEEDIQSGASGSQ
ncbi:hypothetical protein BDZ45DRAFT_744551 [Acephala macrosclerotiorum]|nr:hypothetical protein BDZ45DRAFT_744551 [Acephala macrosclerotiorum]